MTKTACLAAILAIVVPSLAEAQEIDAQPGFYVGAGGGLNWLISSPNNATGVGYAFGGFVGYDFVGPRVDLNVGYGD